MIVISQMVHKEYRNVPPQPGRFEGGEWRDILSLGYYKGFDCNYNCVKRLREPLPFGNSKTNRAVFVSRKCCIPRSTI